MSQMPETDIPGSSLSRDSRKRIPRSALSLFEAQSHNRIEPRGPMGRIEAK
jgi:hypothetical protein